MEFQNWFTRLLNVARTRHNFSEFSISAMDPENWLDYYDRNFTPERALEIDLGLSMTLPLAPLDSDNGDRYEEGPICGDRMENY